MDALKSLKAQLNQLKQETQQLVGDKKRFSKAELEAAKLKRLREEEQAENEEKQKKRKLQEEQLRASTHKRSATQHDGTGNDNQESVATMLPKEEVIRRLRVLGQPATLFGEEDADRMRRLLKAEKDMNVDEDDTLGGHQTHFMAEMHKEDKDKKKKARSGLDDAEKARDKDGKGTTEQQLVAAQADGTANPLMQAFEEAAKKLAEQQAEKNMQVEDLIAKYIRKWSAEWEADLNARPPEVKASGVGKQKWVEFQQTQKYFEPLYERLKKRAVDPELKAGLWMIVQAMRERNYLYAYDIYFKIAVGNAPWPIGVTSVGIHERSAREKISHVMNSQGQAHIMNDEATRKYLQATKRLMTFVQRVHPTDPSRSVDFNSTADETRGSVGHGSDKLALLEAEAHGEDWRALGLPEAPHYMESDGSVKVPPKWSNILRRVDGLGDVTAALPPSPLHGHPRSPSPLPGHRQTPPRAMTPSSPLPSQPDGTAQGPAPPSPQPTTAATNA